VWSLPTLRQKVSDTNILAIQVSGFLSALILLPLFHGLPQVLFATAFSLHFIGDMMRLKKDGLL